MADRGVIGTMGEYSADSEVLDCEGKGGVGLQELLGGTEACLELGVDVGTLMGWSLEPVIGKWPIGLEWKLLGLGLEWGLQVLFGGVVGFGIVAGLGMLC